MAELRRKVKDYEDLDRLIERINGLEEDNKRLRRALSNIRRRGSLPISIILLSLGALSLIASFIYEMIILTFIGLGLVLFGAVIYYSLPTKFVSEKSLFLSIDVIKSLSNIIQNLGYKGRAIFFYPNTLDGLSKGSLFIPVDDDTNLPNEDELAKMQFMYKEGIMIPSHVHSIIRLLEETLNKNLIMFEMSELDARLKEFFVNELRVIDDISIKINGNEVLMSITGKDAAEICKSINMTDKNSIGCPFCASVAFILSKMNSVPVIIDESRAGSERIKTKYLLMDNGL